MLVPRPKATRMQFEGAEVARTTRFLGDVSSEGSIFMSGSMVSGGTPTPPQSLAPTPPKTRGRSFKNRLRAQLDPLKRVGGPSKIASWLQDGPRWPQDGPKMAQDGPKMAQDSPRWPQDGSRWSQEGPKMAQDGPKKALKWPKIARTWSNGGVFL